MDNDIVNDKHRHFNQSPVKIDIIIQSAKIPPVTVIYYFYHGYIDTKLSSMIFHAWYNLEYQH